MTGIFPVFARGSVRGAKENWNNFIFNRKIDAGGRGLASKAEAFAKETGAPFGFAASENYHLREHDLGDKGFVRGKLHDALGKEGPNLVLVAHKKEDLLTVA
jgi:hypothetical protein